MSTTPAAALSSIQASSRECRRVREILTQLENAVGWDNVKDSDDNFGSVELIHRGALDDRVYCLTVKIGPEFPDGAGSLSYHTDDIPPNHNWYNFSGSKSRTNLGSLYAEFVRQIGTFGPLRRALRDLDANSWVLDPPPPVSGLSHLYRRIVVSRGVSVQVTLDPNDLESLPDLKFLGPPGKVRSLRQALARNHHNYDQDYSLVQNIERVLDLELPPAPMEADTANEDFNVDCGICYSFKLGNALPDKACDQNPKCGRLFHEECLLEWIRSSPDYRTSFQTFFGKCPYCDAQISCQMT